MRTGSKLTIQLQMCCAIQPFLTFTRRFQQNSQSKHILYPTIYLPDKWCDMPQIMTHPLPLPFHFLTYTTQSLYDIVPYYQRHYRGANKSLARPGRKQANVSLRMAWISFGALPCRKKKTWWQLASRYCWNRARPWHASELVSFLVGLRTYQHPGTYTINTNRSNCEVSDFLINFSS